MPPVPLQQILLQQVDSALDTDSPTEPMVFTSPSSTGPTSTDYTTDEEEYEEGKVEDKGWPLCPKSWMPGRTQASPHWWL